MEKPKNGKPTANAKGERKRFGHIKYIAKERASDAADLKPAKPVGERRKRLTIDIPAELHRSFKIDCVRQGKKMQEVIRSMIEKHLTKAESGKE